MSLLLKFRISHYKVRDTLWWSSQSISKPSLLDFTITSGKKYRDLRSSVILLLNSSPKRGRNRYPKYNLKWETNSNTLTLKLKVYVYAWTLTMTLWCLSKLHMHLMRCCSGKKRTQSTILPVPFNDLSLRLIQVLSFKHTYMHTSIAQIIVVSWLKRLTLDISSSVVPVIISMMNYNSQCGFSLCRIKLKASCCLCLVRLVKKQER